MYFTRYQMYKKIFSALDIPLRGNILGISGLKFWRGSKNYQPPFPVIAEDAYITEANYPEVRVTRDFSNAGFTLVKTYRVFENPHHRFFIFEYVSKVVFVLLLMNVFS